jgi:RNA polymerase sigma-70 factor (ECF subfamily)
MDAADLFEILVREHADMLTVYLRSLVRDPSLVDDLFQETMLTAWRRLDQFDRSRPFGPWLRGIAAKLVLAERRKSSARMLLCDEQVLEVIGRRLDEVTRRPGGTLDEKLDALRKCLKTLPKAYHAAVCLRYQEELSPPDIAARLAITCEAVKKRLQRARARLLDCLERKLAVGQATL